MTLLSLAAYAATHNVSKQAATDWKKKGYVVFDGDLVDVEKSDAKMKGCGKGRFRIKAHGGRRQAGVRGVRDRPGLDAAPPSEPAQPWDGWAWASNAGNPLSKDVLELIPDDAGADDAEIANLIDYSEWENACTHLGWYRWPATAAPAIASELGLADRAGEIEAVLSRLVCERLFGAGELALDMADMDDPRLKPR